MNEDMGMKGVSINVTTDSSLWKDMLHRVHLTWVFERGLMMVLKYDMPKRAFVFFLI